MPRSLLGGLFALLALHNLGAQERPVIQIVENPRPLWAAGKEWRVVAKPLLDIGAAEGQKEYELAEVRGVLRLGDGTIVVANQQNELRFYDRNGKYVRTAGRRGDGPGEFFQIQHLSLLRDGNIAVVDFRHGIQVYSPDGRFVRLIKTPGSPMLDPRVVFDDGTMILGDWPQGRRGITAAVTDSTTLTYVDPSGAVDTIGRFPAARMVPFMGRSSYQQFGPTHAAFGGAQTMFIGFTDKWEITQYTPSGRPVRVIRRAWQPVPITASDRAAYRTARVNMPGENNQPVPARLREQREALYADEMFAPTMPAYGRGLMDAQGNLWIHEPTPPKNIPANARFHDTNEHPQKWSVIDPAGRWLGMVETPGNFWVFDIGADYIAGIWRDELDVEHVRVYALEKPR